MNGYYPVFCVNFHVGFGVGFGAAVCAGVGTIVSLRGVNKPVRLAETALCIILTFHNAS
jgi:hypothetical protein